MERQASYQVRIRNRAGSISLLVYLKHPLTLMSPSAPQGNVNAALSFKWKIKNYCNLEILNSGAYNLVGFKNYPFF